MVWNGAYIHGIAKDFIQIKVEILYSNIMSILNFLSPYTQGMPLPIFSLYTSRLISKLV